MKKIFYYSLPLTGHCFKGEVGSIQKLFLNFTKWARKYHIGKNQAGVLWFSGSFNDANNRPVGKIISENEINELIQKLIDKLPKSTDVVDLTSF